MKKTMVYMKPYAGKTALGLFTKFTGSVAELVLPFLLSHIIDDLIPLKDAGQIYLMGGLMLLFALVALFGNIFANRLSAQVAGAMTHDIRYDLFRKTSYLKCSQVDGVTVPSLISRLTSDTYYVNQMVARTMRLGVRAPILLLGGLISAFFSMQGWRSYCLPPCRSWARQYGLLPAKACLCICACSARATIWCAPCRKT